MAVFNLGGNGPIKGRNGKYVWIKLRTPKQVARANKDFADAKQFVKQQNLGKGTNPHPILPAARQRNANQRTCNKISVLIAKMNLRF